MLSEGLSSGRDFTALISPLGGRHGYNIFSLIEADVQQSDIRYSIAIIFMKNLWLKLLVYEVSMCTSVGESFKCKLSHQDSSVSHIFF